MTMTNVNFLKQLIGTIKKIGLPVWLLIALYNSCDQFISMEMERGLRGPDGASPWVWLYGILSFFVGLLFPVALTALVLFGLGKQEGSKRSYAYFLGKNLNPLMIETLRSWGKSLMAGLFFIVPGFYRFFMYSLVPFIVSFSKAYDLGKIDALKKSTELVKKNWGKVLLTISIFHLIIPLSLSSFTDEYKVIWITPLACLGVSLIDALLWIIATQILYRITVRFLKEVPDEFAF